MLDLLRQSPTVTLTFRDFCGELFNAKNLHKVQIKIKVFLRPKTILTEIYIKNCTADCATTTNNVPIPV